MVQVAGVISTEIRHNLPTTAHVSMLYNYVSLLPFCSWNGREPRRGRKIIQNGNDQGKMEWQLGQISKFRESQFPPTVCAIWTRYQSLARRKWSDIQLKGITLTGMAPGTKDLWRVSYLTSQLQEIVKEQKPAVQSMELDSSTTRYWIWFISN